MKHFFVCAAAVVAFLSSTSAGRAQITIYSFEDVTAFGPDGFFGLGATVSQEPVIGVTHLENSLKYETGGAAFIGARTESVIPAELADPPGVDHILVDVTIPETYAGAFADLGVTIFGHALNGGGGPVFGLQVQFADTESLSTLSATPGTYLDVRINLDQSLGPYRPGESFNDIFGPGDDDLTVAAAFQFFVSKDSGVPMTFYLDNVRLVGIPEASPGWPVGLGAMATIGFTLRRRYARHRTGHTANHYADLDPGS